MKEPESLYSIIGKTIERVVVVEVPKGQPEYQFFLLFDDGTAYELWVDGYLRWASQTDKGGFESTAGSRRRRGAKIAIIPAVGGVGSETHPASGQGEPLGG